MPRRRFLGKLSFRGMGFPEIEGCIDLRRLFAKPPNTTPRFLGLKVCVKFSWLIPTL